MTAASVSQAGFDRLWSQLEPIGHAASGRYRRFACTDTDLQVREWFVRWRFDLPGEANHAGTTSLRDCRDPTLAPAALVLRARELLDGAPYLPTGAGHDAGILAGAGVPAAMLFVRRVVKGLVG